LTVYEKLIHNLNDANFNDKAIELFNYQAEHNALYKKYLRLLGERSQNIQSINEIACLPVELFKHHKINTFFESEAANTTSLIFKSSGTTQSKRSTHYVQQAHIYNQVLLKGFESFYGAAKNYCYLALLPSYLENKESSLIYMVEQLMQQSKHPLNNFYLYNYKDLANALKKLESEQQPTILIGVTFALLDFATQYQIPLKHTTIIETGGMKGRRKEMIRAEVHQLLKAAFGQNQIHSEYGMTELLSQSYALIADHFQPIFTKKIIIKDLYDPFKVVENGATGCINVIDLANIHSCAFIQTADIGRLHNDGSFDVLGRIDNSDIRGCNLMAEL